MSEQNNISSLDQEKKEVKALLNQQTVAEFEMQINTVPENYFEQFSENIVFTIQKKKKPSLLIRLSKLSVAAAILFLVAGSYFIVSTYYISDASTIAIHEIPTVEIDSYVSNNEWVADAEIQMEINKIGLNLDVDNSSKDSID